MKIRVICEDKDNPGYNGHLHHAKNISILVYDYGGGVEVIVENSDGSFETYTLTASGEGKMIRIEDVETKGS